MADERRTPRRTPMRFLGCSGALGTPPSTSSSNTTRTVEGEDVNLGEDEEDKTNVASSSSSSNNNNKGTRQTETSPVPPSHFSFGEIASQATLPPPSSKYPTFNNALELTRQLGICPSIETLKTLENVEGKGKERELEVRLDPRIRKHNLPRGKVQGQTSRAKRKRIVNPDEVPLEWDEDAGALKWDEQDDVDDPMGLSGNWTCRNYVFL